MTPTAAQVAEAYLNLTKAHLATGLGHATIYPTGIRVYVTDPDVRDRLVAAYGLARDHSFGGHYTGLTGDGVPLVVTLTIPAGIIPAGIIPAGIIPARSVA